MTDIQTDKTISRREYIGSEQNKKELCLITSILGFEIHYKDIIVYQLIAFYLIIKVITNF